MLKNKKIYLFILILLSILMIVGIPSLARFINRNIDNSSVWNGDVASSYQKGNGTESNPYVIANGEELAYFSSMLQTEDYENIYFLLKNDIVLNDGIFNYNVNDGITYVLNSTTYYIDEYTNNYYDSHEKTNLIGTVNSFASLDGFKGHLNGQMHRIYGLYITSNSLESLGLFTNLEGDIRNLYVENAFVYGGKITGGIASNATNTHLTNVLFNGYVIGNNSSISHQSETSLNLNSVILTNTEMTTNINLVNNLLTKQNYVSATISGNYTVTGSSGSETIKINNTTLSDNLFNLDLGTTMLSSIPLYVSTTSTDEVTVSFTNVVYHVTYNYAVSGGIIGLGNNITMEKVINRGYVSGYSISSGLVAVSSGLSSYTNSYNRGTVDSSDLASGLLGVIENNTSNTTLTNTYNNGVISGNSVAGLIGIMKNSNPISLSNSFDTLSSYTLNTIINTTVNVTNSYYVSDNSTMLGSTNGSFISTTIQDLENKNNVITNLGYQEFISLNNLASNSNNIWVYENGNIPILYIDDTISSLGIIHVSSYAYDNLSMELDPIVLNSSFTLRIDPYDALILLSEKYYYRTDGSVALTESDLENVDWITYTDPLSITMEGKYVYYVKVVDYDNNVSYMNTDLLILDLTGPSINLSLNNYTWTNYHNERDYYYINKNETLTIEVQDNVISDFNIAYYFSTTSLTLKQLDGLDDNLWISYNNGVVISNTMSIIYVKVSTSWGYTKYACSDYIVFNGYSNSYLLLGKNEDSDNPNITNNSKIETNFTYQSSINYSGYTHNLVTNLLLPINTQITLIDKIKGRSYVLVINSSEDLYGYNDSCDEASCRYATYPLTLFKEIGTSSNNYFSEISYYQNNLVSEDFTIIIDFLNTNISTNYLNITPQINLVNGVKRIGVLEETIKSFNLYYNTSATLSLTSDYSGSINYNSNATININLNTLLTYQKINSKTIYDTTYDSKNRRLYIRLEDSLGNKITSDYLKNMLFLIDNIEYYPLQDGSIYINLGCELNISKTLVVRTNTTNTTLSEGTYYLKISNYADYGINYSSLANTITVPVIVSNSNPILNYSFNVSMDNNSRLISKSDEVKSLLFNIEVIDVSNPSVKISLYKKDEMTAYNQDYSLINLLDYTDDSLILDNNNIYYALKDNILNSNSFTLNLKTTNLEYSGYKFVFDLYDGSKKIDTIEKYFIVR